MKVIGMIPARMQSSRLPNKPLVDICGLPMIVHVLKRALLAQSLDEVYVVTDSTDIRQIVENHHGKVIMTGSHHQTGSDRIAEAAQQVHAGIIVNIQGDEALLDPAHVDAVTQGLINNPDCQIALLVTPYKKENSPSDIKVVVNQKNEVMYLSRSDIPSNARTPNRKMLKAYHIVPFHKEFLIRYSSLSKTPLEEIEFNEYLRILENGYKIKAIHVDSDAVSVDTPEDLEYVRNMMMKDPVRSRY